MDDGIKKPYVVSIEYKDKSYETLKYVTETFPTREGAEKWAQTKLTSLKEYAKPDFRVFYGELNEEYQVEQKWVFTPVKAPSRVSNTITSPTGLEV